MGAFICRKIRVIFDLYYDMFMLLPTYVQFHEKMISLSVKSTWEMKLLEEKITSQKNSWMNIWEWIMCIQILKRLKVNICLIKIELFHDGSKMLAVF